MSAAIECIINFSLEILKKSCAKWKFFLEN